MKSIMRLRFISLFLAAVLITPVPVYANKASLKLSCEDFSFSDVVSLVGPHMDPVLHTALVMQGESSGYTVSSALNNIVERNALPEVIQKILTALDKANC